MNTPNPLVPQSSMLEQKAKGKSSLPLTVFVFIAIHAVLLGGLLIVGCKKDQPKPATDQQTNDLNSLPPLMDTNVVVETNPPVDTNVAVNPPLATNEPPVVEPPPAIATSEYSVVAGDYLEKIAKKHGISTKALQDANPGVVPTKLKVGQKLQIPGGAAAPSSISNGNTQTSSDTVVYVVKNGDNLTKIALRHGTTLKALKSLNHLKLDGIKVGQKLKVPGKITTTEPGPTPVTSPEYVTPLPTDSATPK